MAELVGGAGATGGAGSGPEPATGSPGEGPPVTAVQSGRLMRNTVSLVLSQFVSTPLGILVNAVLARKLGADDFGTIYLASTMVGLGFLFVDWGQQATIAQRVALRRDQAAETLGTSLVLKLIGVVLASAALGACAWLLGYSRALFVALALTIAQQAFVSFSASYTAVMRGLERLDWVSGLTIAGNLLAAALVIPVALLGGGLAGTLGSQAAAAVLALGVATWFAAKLRLLRPTATRAMGRVLLRSGGAFVLFNLVLALQPYVDAVILSRLSTSEAVGWYAAARRLLGVLIFPATTVGYVLYPTLSRLWLEDRQRFSALVSSTLRLVILIGVCASVGTYLFAQFAIQVVYGRAAFGPAVANLKILSAFVFLLYFTLILGAAIAASGKQMLWAGAQTLCVVVSAVGDPLLVPLCERHFGNGGLGICLSTVLSELLMVAAALILLRGEGLLRQLGAAALPALAGGASMWLTAWALHGLPVPVGMVVSVVVYLGVVVALGGFDRSHLALIKEVVRMKSRGPRQGASA